MGVILDSSVLISAEREKLAWRKFLESVAAESLFISAVTLSEIWHGCHRVTIGMPRSVRQGRLKFVQQVETLFSVLAFYSREAYVHAEIWAGLEKIGQRIGLHDLMIAATALAQGHLLATLKEREFERIPRLRVLSVKQFLRR